MTILQSTELPPVPVIVKNLPFLIATRLSGWKKSEGLLLAARDNVMSPRKVTGAPGQRPISAFSTR